jgi:ankyrin repeat protein
VNQPDPDEKFSPYRDSNKSALHIAVHWNLEAVELLLHGGARVDITDGSIETPLHHAARLQSPIRPEIVQRLLQAGAKIDQTAYMNETPLHVAAYGNAEIVRILLAAGAAWEAQTTYDVRYTPIELAAKFGNAKTIEVFLEYMPLRAINRVNPHSQLTLLHLAAMNDKHGAEMIQLLIKAGADLTLANTLSDRTPYKIAQETGNSKAIKLLAPWWEKLWNYSAHTLKMIY